MGGCQKLGSLFGPSYNTAPKTWGTQKGAIILTTTHVPGLGQLGVERLGCLQVLELQAELDHGGTLRGGRGPSCAY